MVESKNKSTLLGYFFHSTTFYRLGQKYVRNFVGFWSIWSQEKVLLRFTDLIEQPKSANLHWPVEVTWVATMCFKFLSCQVSHVTKLKMTMNERKLWVKIDIFWISNDHCFKKDAFNKLFDHRVPGQNGIWIWKWPKNDCEKGLDLF